MVAHAVQGGLGGAEAGGGPEDGVEGLRAGLYERFGPVVPDLAPPAVGGRRAGRHDASVDAVADDEGPLPGLRQAVGGGVEEPGR